MIKISIYKALGLHDGLIDIIKKTKKEALEIEGLSEKRLNLTLASNKYFSSSNTANSSIDSNSNLGNIDVLGHDHEVTKPHLKALSYNNIYKELRRLFNSNVADTAFEKTFDGHLYQNDSHAMSSQRYYCYNYSTYDIMIKGLPMIKTPALPPRHFASFMKQLEQFIVYASNSSLGACGIADLLVMTSYYIEKILKTGYDSHVNYIPLEVSATFDEAQRNLLLKVIKENVVKNDCNYSELIKSFTVKQYDLFEKSVMKYVEETLTSFVYTINQPSRSGLQSPFVNVSVYDEEFLTKSFSGIVFPNGSSDLNIPLIMKIQDLYLNLMNKELARSPLAFPVTSICISTIKVHRDTKVPLNELELERVKNDEKSIDWINDINDENFVRGKLYQIKKYGLFNIFASDSSLMASCCRLRSNMGYKPQYFNSVTGGSGKIGSLCVCTINLYRLARENANSPENFKKELIKLTSLANKINYSKRKLIEKRINLLQYSMYNNGFTSIDSQYLTVGINGMYEAIEAMGYDPTEQDGVDFGSEFIIDVINEVNVKAEEQYTGCKFNCEQVPGEQSSIKLAKKDKVYGYDSDFKFYSNQFVPLIKHANLFDRMRLQGEYDNKFSGGSSFHINVDEPIVDEETLYELIRASINAGVILFTFNYFLKKCKNNHITVGKHKLCPICGEPITEEFIKVVGYLASVAYMAQERQDDDVYLRQQYNLASILGGVTA